jgi:P pilus assembly chaperone PapD
MLIRLLPILAIAAALFPATGAEALTVTPVQLELAAAGAKSRATVSVVNNSSAPLPVEAVIEAVNLDETGVPKPAGATEDFLVMPPQALIAPGATQNFRVQWLGEPGLETSRSFMLYMNQIPVKMPKGKSGVQVVMSMGVMINVAAAEGAPSLRLVGTGITNDRTGARRPVITVENPSNMHALLPQSTIRLAGGGWSTTLTPAMLDDSMGIGLVQPGKRRKFVLPVELPANVNSVQASLEMGPRRK